MRTACRLACCSPGAPGASRTSSISRWCSSAIPTSTGSGRRSKRRETTMKRARRHFVQALGATALAPLVAPSVPTLWAQAAQQVEQTGEVSREVTLALLDAQGTRGIFDDPKEFEELRAALARKIEVHKYLRNFELPDDVEPLLAF